MEKRFIDKFKEEREREDMSILKRLFQIVEEYNQKTDFKLSLEMVARELKISYFTIFRWKKKVEKGEKIKIRLIYVKEIKEYINSLKQFMENV